MTERKRTQVVEIGARIAEARLNLGLTQQILATRLNIRMATLSSWEIGKTQPRTGDLLDLAEQLNVRPEWLLCGSQ